jgi:pyroglutamyl-peptidase
LAGLSVGGIHLRRLAPDMETRSAVLDGAKDWILKRTTVENSRFLCYNHLSDYGFSEEIEIENPVLLHGEFAGALIDTEYELDLGEGRVKRRSYGLLLTDGRVFGRTCCEYLYSAPDCGSSKDVEYELIRRDSVLVTAFEPFGGDAVNPTAMLLSSLPDEIGGMRVNKLLLPVEFGRAAELAKAGFDRVSPAAVIMFGQAGGRAAVTPEAIGKNLMDARIPDNAGYQPKNEPIIEGGPSELYSTLPNEAIRDALLASGIPSEISRDAGLYVCNSLLYSMLAHVNGRVPAGFVHVPFIREQVEGFPGREGKPFMEFGAVRTSALTVIAEVIRSIR